MRIIQIDDFFLLFVELKYVINRKSFSPTATYTLPGVITSISVSDVRSFLAINFHFHPIKLCGIDSHIFSLCLIFQSRLRFRPCCPYAERE